MHPQSAKSFSSCDSPPRGSVEQTTLSSLVQPGSARRDVRHRATFRARCSRRSDFDVRALARQTRVPLDDLCIHCPNELSIRAIYTHCSEDYLVECLLRCRSKNRVMSRATAPSEGS